MCVKVDYIFGERKNQVYGIGRHQMETLKYLDKRVDFKILDYPSTATGLHFAFYRYIYYPLYLKRNCREDSIKHIQSQSYSYLLNLFDLERTIVTCHDIIPLITGDYISYTSRKMIGYDIRGLQKADHIIAISEHTKKDISIHLNYPDDQVSVIYNGVDHSRYYPKPSSKILKKYGISGDGPIILNVGSEQPHKNIETLIRAFQSVVEKIPDARLIKVGKPSWPGARKALESLIKKLDLNVTFLDYVEEEDLPKLYNAADVFVFPSLYEGFGLPPLEAMACGIPVVCSNTTSLPEVVGDAAITVNPKDIDEISDRIHEILTDEDLRLKLAKKGPERAKRFTWEKSAEETLKVYEELEA